MLVDHFSGVVMVRYYKSMGETQKNLYDFLLWCWKKKDSIIFNDVPKVLYWDKGSANTSSAIKSALKLLDVKDVAHEAGNPRAKGAVEKANNTVETQFESRLLYEPVASVDELNVAVGHWMNAFNSNLIKRVENGVNRRFSMVKHARYELWSTYRSEHLRLLPDIDICKLLLSSKPVERTVRADLTVSFNPPPCYQKNKCGMTLPVFRTFTQKK